MVARACDVLEPRTAGVGIVTDDPALGEVVGRPIRGDVRPGSGPAGGILTALAWARDLGLSGVVVLACDLPLVPGPLIDLLVGRFAGARPLVPASPGPLGVEPLCAIYPVAVGPAIGRSLEDGPLPAHRVLEELEPDVLPLEAVASVCDPRVAFLNVNRAEDRWRAETLLAGLPG